MWTVQCSYHDDKQTLKIGTITATWQYEDGTVFTYTETGEYGVSKDFEALNAEVAAKSELGVGTGSTDLDVERVAQFKANAVAAKALNDTRISDEAAIKAKLEE